MQLSKIEMPRRGVARSALISLLIITTLGVSACFTLAATGIAMGALAIIDRRTIGAQTEDQGIELKASAEIRKSLADTSGISITSYNRRVLLTGQVLSGADKQTAGALVAGLPNVKAVFNELQIAGKASFQVQASDTTVTTRVKTALLRDPDVPGNSVKVTTESSVVYLMGLITNQEANRAAQIASQTPGVARVITMFERVSPEEAARLSTEAKDTTMTSSEGQIAKPPAAEKK